MIRRMRGMALVGALVGADTLAVRKPDALPRRRMRSMCSGE